MFHFTRCRHATGTRRQSIHLSGRRKASSNGLFRGLFKKLFVNNRNTFKLLSACFHITTELTFLCVLLSGRLVKDFLEPWLQYRPMISNESTASPIISAAVAAKMYHRVISQKLKVIRPFEGQSSLVVHYKMQSHERAVSNPQRLGVMEEDRGRFQTDGLSNLRYKKLDFQSKLLYTHILVDFQTS